MKEPLSNIGLWAEHNRAKAGKFSGQDPKQFIGKYVKIAFDATHPVTRKSVKEHMWVKVESEKDGTLTGILDNDPIYRTKVQCGDTVSLTVDQIEMVTE